MRPVGKYRFKLPGEEQIAGDIYFLLYKIKDRNAPKDYFNTASTNPKRGLYAIYNWNILSVAGFVGYRECSVRKVER